MALGDWKVRLSPFRGLKVSDFARKTCSLMLPIVSSCALCLPKVRRYRGHLLTQLKTRSSGDTSGCKVFHCQYCCSALSTHCYQGSNPSCRSTHEESVTVIRLSQYSSNSQTPALQVRVGQVWYFYLLGCEIQADCCEVVSGARHDWLSEHLRHSLLS